MELKRLPYDLTVCRISDISAADLNSEFFFIGKTDEEVSLVCRAEDVPSAVTDREDGWKGFRIAGVLDFSLIGVLSEISGVLAGHGISIFAVSTYNTDYFLVRSERFDHAMKVLGEAGYTVL